jgi:hypothetical protein
MARHELEIEISTSGEINVHVKGAKGKQCLKYVELLGKLGKVKEQKLTGEYYEPGPTVQITDQTHTRVDR